MMRHTVCEIYFYKINFLSPTLFFLSHSAITFLLCKKTDTELLTKYDLFKNIT